VGSAPLPFSAPVWAFWPCSYRGIWRYPRPHQTACLFHEISKSNLSTNCFVGYTSQTNQPCQYWNKEMKNSKIVHVGQLKTSIGLEVTLSGWLYNSRSSGKVQFLIIRDGTGHCQCIVEKGKVSDDLFDQLTFRPVKAPRTGIVAHRYGPRPRRAKERGRLRAGRDRR